jgi:glycosyltransferase involved in cell wall biosynthesis
MNALTRPASRAPVPAAAKAPRLRALLLSFEFGERISGGLGRVINGVTEELRHEVDLDVFLVYFDALRLGFSAKLYRCDREQRAEFVRTFTRGSAFRNCVELLRSGEYALLHVFTVHSSLSELLTLLERELPELKVVYSVHSLVKFEQGIRKNPRSFLACEDRMLRRASLIHVLNQATLGYLREAYPELAARKQVRIVGNGIEPRDLASRDPAFQAELDARLGRGRYTVAWLSRWAHGKGLEHFVEAAELLLEEGHDIQFVLAGRKYLSWEKEWYSYLFKIQRLSRRVGERLVVLGWLNASQRNTLLARADCCVVPSELEYYPYSVLEPAALGLPLICSDLACVRELFTEGEDCLYFRPRDSRGLAQRITELAREPQRARALARSAQRKVSLGSNWQTLAGRYHAMYRDALEPPPPAAFEAP